MAPLPLLRLPLPVIKLFVLQLSLADVFMLSFCSKKTEELMRTTRVKLKELQLHRQLDTVLFIAIVDSSMSFCWNLKQSNGTENDANEHFQCEIRGVPLRIRAETENSPTTTTTFVTCDDLFPTSVLLAEHLIDVFRKPISTFHLFSNHSTDFPSLVRIPTIQSVEELELYGDITREGLRFVLDNFSSAENVHIGCTVADDFRYDKPFNLKTLSLSRQTWITQDTLLSMSCESIRLYWCDTEVSDFNEFVKNWIRSDDRKLCDVTVFRVNEFVPVDLSVLLDGIHTTPWDSSKRAAVFVMHSGSSVCARGGYDIERNDGVLATILLEPHLRFLVWKDRFPMIDEST